MLSAIRKTVFYGFLGISTLGIVETANADTIDAYCEFFRDGQDIAEASMPCRFYQGMGHIVIIWADGVESDFLLQSSDPDWVYIDKLGGRVYREDRPASSGAVAFHMENGKIIVYTDAFPKK